MKKVLINDFKYDGTTIKKLDVFMDDNGDVVLLPTLFAVFLRLHQVVYKKKITINSLRNTEEELVKVPIAEVTLDQYVNYLLKYFQFIEDSASQVTKDVSVHMNETVSEEFINYYVNDILVQSEGAGHSSIKGTISAILSYYNWLAYGNLSSIRKIYLEPANRETVARNTKLKQSMKYISTHGRFEILKKCSSLRDELLICNGYQVGLRSKENCGILLSDFTYNHVRKKGLLSLFDELKRDNSKQVFEYFLAGKYSKGTRNNGKGGRSRNIYFSRQLLERMREYYLVERAEIMEKNGLSHDVFFVKNDSVTAGEPIKNNTATNCFRVLKQGISCIGYDNSYHDLRHSFGTDLFHQEIGDEPATQIGFNHPAILTVAKRLGHAIDTSKAMAKVTYEYVRLHSEMVFVEGLAC